MRWLSQRGCMKAIAVDYANTDKRNEAVNVVKQILTVLGRFQEVPYRRYVFKQKRFSHWFKEGCRVASWTDLMPERAYNQGASNATFGCRT